MSSKSEVFSLKIEISPGKREYLKIYEDDEPEEVAHNFCQQFKLDCKFEEGLSNLIEFHIDNIIESETSRYRTTLGRKNDLSFESHQYIKKPDMLEDRNKLDLYYALFDELSDPCLNTMSYESLDTEKLPKSVCRILEPLFDELQESKESITFSEFTRAMDVLLKTLTARDRILLLNNYLEGAYKVKNLKKQELREQLENLKTLKHLQSLQPYPVKSKP
ncbi:hypothetical protein SteCoe_31376 [Stentor coeruleus]|uniref:EF-hand domain-containing protein n=1 Tax=Stentor coeruleus TaxID=5963 RepID=A0A1R2B1N7_9CILI|nr:hypothetical protein SteCoe_31376 [Stentor coeruleus]